MKDAINKRIIKRHPDLKTKIRKVIINPTKMKQSFISHSIVVERKGIYPQYAEKMKIQRLNGISTELRNYNIFNKS